MEKDRRFAEGLLRKLFVSPSQVDRDTPLYTNTHFKDEVEKYVESIRQEKHMTAMG